MHSHSPSLNLAEMADYFFSHDPHIKQICKVFRDNDYECYIVGGAIRDYLLQIPISDIDLASNALPHIVQQLFRNTIPTGIKHGTVTILQGQKTYETTTYRLDTDYKDYRHTQVLYQASIHGDLARRDFTCNAMAFDPLTGIFLDPYKGQNAIQIKQLITVGKARVRYSEDALRMLRAIRFCATRGFFVKKRQLDIIRNTRKLLLHISVERKREELLKLLKGDDVRRGLDYLYKTHILRDVFMLRYSPKQFGSLKRLLAIASPSIEERLAACLYMDYAHINKSNYQDRARDFLDNLKISNSQKKRVLLLLKVAYLNFSKLWKATKIRAFLSFLTDDPSTLAFAYIIARITGIKPSQVNILQSIQSTQALKEQEGVYDLKRLEFSGNLLLQQSYLQPIAPKEIGVILRYLLRKILFDPRRNTKQEIQPLLKLYGACRTRDM